MHFMIYSKLTCSWLQVQPSSGIAGALPSGWGRKLSEAKRFCSASEASHALMEISKVTNSHVVMDDGSKLWDIYIHN